MAQEVDRVTDALNRLNGMAIATDVAVMLLLAMEAARNPDFPEFAQKDF